MHHFSTPPIILNVSSDSHAQEPSEVYIIESGVTIKSAIRVLTFTEGIKESVAPLHTKVSASRLKTAILMKLMSHKSWDSHAKNALLSLYLLQFAKH